MRTVWNRKRKWSPVMILLFISGCNALYYPLNEVLAATTFNDSSSIDTNTQNALGDTQPTPDPDFQALTSIQMNVYPGQDDVSGGAGISFYGFPDETSFNNGQNQQPPQTESCGRADGSCSTFTGEDGSETGPIVLQVKASPVVKRYRLIDTGVKVPYGYVDYGPPLMYCQAHAGPEGKKQECSIGPGQYVSYDTNLLLNPWRQYDDINNDTTIGCRGINNGILGNYLVYNNDRDQDFITPGCFACPIVKNVPYGGQVTSVPHFCPFACGHPAQIPTQDTDKVTHNQQQTRCTGYETAAMAGLEPYYYWCYGLGVGYHSDLPDASLTDSGAYNGNGIWQGQYVDILREWATAYQCTLSDDLDDNCPPYKSVLSLVNAGIPKCNLGNSKDPICSSDKGTGQCQFIEPCSASVLEQVTSAANFLTQSCSARDVGQNRNSRLDIPDYYEDRGFLCPGDAKTYVPPNLFAPPEGVYYARCSAGCNNPNTVTQVDTKTSNTNQNVDDYAVNSVMKERATLELGPVTCKVYRVVPQPIVSIGVDVVITAADGVQKTISLGSDQLTFGVADFGYANFSARINRITSSNAGFGENVEGLVLFCGTEENIDVGAGGRDVSQCEALDDPRYNISDRETCSVPVGVFRGVLPGANPNDNPWPDIMRKMKSDFLDRCKQLSDQGQNCVQNGEDVNTIADQKLNSCAVLTPQYTSFMNCGRRTSVIFIPQSRSTDYGDECGQMGFRNAYAKTTSGAQFMCQQGGFTCTPGYGGPRFGTGSASGSANSPCQELGVLNNLQYDTMPNGCADPNRQAPPDRFPPVWRWGAEDEFYPGGFDPENVDINDLLTQGVPNTWYNGNNMYTQDTASTQSYIRVDLQIITNSKLNGAFVTFAGGKINQTDTFYCDATVSEASSGSVALEFCNTSPSLGGSYTGDTVCYLPETATFYNNYQDLTITTDPPIQFGLAAGECRFETWGFQVTGPIAINSIYCTTKLFAGPAASTVGLLDQTEYTCDIQVPGFIDLETRDIRRSFTNFDCDEYGLWCLLDFQNAWFRDITYVVMLILITFGVIYAVVTSSYITNSQLLKRARVRYAKQVYEGKAVHEEQYLHHIKDAVREVQQEAPGG